MSKVVEMVDGSSFAYEAAEFEFERGPEGWRLKSGGWTVVSQMCMVLRSVGSTPRKG